MLKLEARRAPGVLARRCLATATFRRAHDLWKCVSGALFSGAAGAGRAGRVGGRLRQLLNPLETCDGSQVLKFEARRAPGVLGASVFGYGDAYARLQPVLGRLRSAARAAAAAATPTAAGAARLGADGRAAPRFFIVAADFTGAFDAVCPERALALAEGLLQAPEYVVTSHDEARCCPHAHTLNLTRSQQPSPLPGQPCLRTLSGLLSSHLLCCGLELFFQGLGSRLRSLVH